mgnify:CR=1 FL=1
MAAGGYHSMAIGLDDALHVWGRGGEGQLGNDSREGCAPSPAARRARESRGAAATRRR